MITKKQQAELAAYLKKTPKESQCSMLVRGVKSTAQFWFLPVLGWIEPKTVPTLFLSGALLKVGDQAHAGSASWQIPLTPHNGDNPLVVLTSLGWRGQLWPQDKGWPEAGSPEATGLLRLINGVPLSHAFSFPPHETKGNMVLKVLVSKTQGIFPLPPQVNEEDQIQPTAEWAKKLERLKTDPTVFMPPGWTPGSSRKVTSFDYGF